MTKKKVIPKNEQQKRLNIIRNLKLATKTFIILAELAAK